MEIKPSGWFALCRYQPEQCISTEIGISEHRRYLMEIYSVYKQTKNPKHQPTKTNCGIVCWIPPLYTAVLCSLRTGCFQKIEKVRHLFVRSRLTLRAPPYPKVICKPWTAKGTRSVSAVNSQQLSSSQAARHVPGTRDSALTPARRTSRFALVRATSGRKCLKLNTVFASFVIKTPRSFISASEMRPRVSVRSFWRVLGCLTSRSGR